MDLKEIRKMDRDDLLNLVGLQRRRGVEDWIWPAMGLFAAGALVGAGIALMLAPRSGRELREALRDRLERGGEDASPGFPKRPGVSLDDAGRSH